MGDIYPIHIPSEILNSGIFWESGNLLKVNLGNLINALKEHYGYTIDNFDNTENYSDKVSQGQKFIETEYSDLYGQSNEKMLALEISISSPNSFYVKF